MYTLIGHLRKKSMQTYRYSDCDGDNNYGSELNEVEFARRVIDECVKVLSKEDNDNRYKQTLYSHFGLKA